MARTNVMAVTRGGESAAAFLSEHFRSGGVTVVEPMTPAARIPMIPLLVSPHDGAMLDTNVAMVSTKFAVQPSCMVLYPRYEGLTGGGLGAAFCAHTEDGRLVGLSTAKVGDSSFCTVDSFVHRHWSESWPDLMQAALDWGASQGATAFCGRRGKRR